MIRYVVKYDGTKILYDSFDPDTYPLTSGTCSIEVNGSSDSMQLSVPVSNPCCSCLTKMKESITLIVYAFNDNGVEVLDTYIPFHGRILSLEEDDYGNKNITCESAINFLNDAKSRGIPFNPHSSDDTQLGSRFSSGILRYMESLGLNSYVKTFDWIRGIYVTKYTSSDTLVDSSIKKGRHIHTVFEDPDNMQYVDGLSDLYYLPVPESEHDEEYSDYWTTFTGSYEGILDTITSFTIKRFGGFLYAKYYFDSELNDYITWLDFVLPQKYANDDSEGGIYDFRFIHPNEYNRSDPIEYPNEGTVDDQGEIPVDDQGEIPVDDQGEIPVDDQGEIPLSNLPNPEEDYRYDYSQSPEFCYGYNVVNVKKEDPITDDVITGIFPSGSDFALDTDTYVTSSQPDMVSTIIMNEFNSRYSNGSDGYVCHIPFGQAGIFSERLVKKYGYLVKPIQWSDVKISQYYVNDPPSSWPNAISRDTLYNALDALVNYFAYNWMVEHQVTMSQKYTITGLEPIEYGRKEGWYGNYYIRGSKFLVRLMYGVRYVNPYKDEKIILPCLGIKYDLLNHANNEYVIGPFIPENYNETNISNS